MKHMPTWAWIPSILATGMLTLPVLGMLGRIPWSALGDLLTSRRALDALRLSLTTSLTSTVLVLIFGIPLALILARSHGRWVTFVRALITIPMVLPPVVAGLALLATFGRRGWLGEYLSRWGVEIGFTTVAVIMAQVFVSMPFLIVSLEGALRINGELYERAAANLGASPSKVFWRITLPLATPAIISGAALSFARSLGEFGATLTFAGSLQGKTRTLPLEIYLLRESDSALALALSVVVIAVALLVLIATGWATKVARHD